MTTTEAIPEVLFENIPAEMKTYRAWVCWRAEERAGQLTKIPYDARRGRRASSTDSRTWRTFIETMEAFERGSYDGIGFVFSTGDPFTGIDLDGCRDPETGEIQEWAREIIDTLDSYTEASPSSTGVHIITTAVLPERQKNRQGPIEVYSERRFFTVTGKEIA